jgi:hypothetical protein
MLTPVYHLDKGQGWGYAVTNMNNWHLDSFKARLYGTEMISVPQSFAFPVQMKLNC